MDNNNQIDPSKIMQIGMGFWASKVLLTAVNLKLFTQLAKGPLQGDVIRERLGLHKRSLYDFLDTLVSLGFLQRTGGIKESGMYSNSADVDLFLDENKPQYIGGVLKMSNNRLYPFWNDLETGLKTGLPQNESRNNGTSMFEAIYEDSERMREFINAMAGVQMGAFMSFSQNFDFSPYKTHCDIGGSGGHLSMQIALNNKHINCTTFDLPKVSNIANEIIQSMGLSERIDSLAGDFFNDDFPKVDVITMGNILHDWGKPEKHNLIKKAYDALPKGGKLVIIENIIDDDRKENAFGLLMSLNMLIETETGYDFSKLDFDELAYDIGFSSTEKMHLAGPTSAVIAIK